MLEVVFSEIAANRLIYAQHMGEGEYRGHEARSGLDVEGWPQLAGTGRMHEEFELEARRKWEQATPLGGSFSDVFCFPDDYSLGPVVGWGWNRPGERADALEALFSGSTFSKSRVRRAAEVAADNLGRLIERLHTDEEPHLRIWSSHFPKDRCGVCWLLAAIGTRAGTTPPVTVVRLPRAVHTEDGWQTYMGWDSVAPEEYFGLQRFAEHYDAGMTEYAAREWRAMEHQNGSLRVFVNGRLVSVPITFYDQFIESAAAGFAEDFRENDLIFSVIDKYDPGIGDDWISFRIDAMIADGRLRAVSTASDAAVLYSRMLGKGPMFPTMPHAAG